MKRKLTALLTLLLFAGCIFGQSAAAMAATANDGKSYTATDATPAVQNAIDGMTLLRVQDGSSAGVLAYGLNATRPAPEASGTANYKKLPTTANQDWAGLVDQARNAGTIRQDVLNVIWNGYPYFAGSWKGVTTSLVASGSGLNVDVANQLSNIAVTQQAIWYYTDSRAASTTAAKDVTTLVAAAEKNPAPANFDLDLYDGSAATTKAGQRVQSLVALSEGMQQKTVSIKLTHEWRDADDKALSGVTTPALAFALYEADAPADAAPLATYNLNDTTGIIAFTLFDDEQSYRLQPVLSGETEGFTAAKAQTFSLKGEQGPIVHLDFVSTYAEPEKPAHEPQAASVPLSAEVTIDSKAPSNSAYTLLLKDEAGTILQTKTNVGKTVTFDPLSFAAEGNHTYTISMQAGSDSKVTYDKAVYKVLINVSKGEDYTAAVTYEKDGVVYTGVPVFASKAVSSTTTTTTTTNNISVTVNKVWKNDKTSSRPSSVQVRLYRNGSAYGNAVTLNSSNGWKYTWSNLSSAYRWSVDETSVPSGYTKNTTNSGNTWTITNTAKSTTTAVTTTKPTTTSTRSTPATDDISHINHWVTIAIISLSGMVVIAIIWLLSDRRRLRSKE